MLLRAAAARLLGACVVLGVAACPTGAHALTSYSVTTTADAGAPGAPGTLRWAFAQAATDADDSLISFTVVGTIALVGAPLPVQTQDEVLTLDATGQGIVLDGQALSSGSGIELSDGTLVVEALTLRNFPTFGIELNNAHDSRIGPAVCGGSAAVQVVNNIQSGVLISGAGAINNVVRCAAIRSNGDDGITIIYSAHANRVEDNFEIASNTTNGVKIASSAYQNEVRRNLKIEKNVQSGVLIAQGSFENVVAGNVLQLNFFDGIQIDASADNVVTRDGSSTTQIKQNRRSGITINNGATGNLVTGATSIEQNSVSGVDIFAGSDNNVVLDSLIFNHIGAAGVSVRTSSGNVIGAVGVGNTVWANGPPVYVAAGSSCLQILSASNTLVEGNTISQCVQGIEINASTGTDVQHNTLEDNYQNVRLRSAALASQIGPGNLIQSATTHGVVVDGSSAGNIIGNTITDNGWAGVYVHQGRAGAVQRIEYNVISGNGSQIYNANFYSSSSYPGATVLPEEEYYWPGVYIGNTGSDWIIGPANTISSQQHCIMLHRSSAQVRDNGYGLDADATHGIFDCEKGIRVTGGSPTIDGNRIRDNSSDGIHVFGGDPIITGNRFSGNDRAGIYAELNPRLVPANFFNTYNSSVGSGQVQAVPGAVDLNGADDTPAHPTIQSNVFAGLSAGTWGIYARETKPQNYLDLINQGSGFDGNSYSGLGRLYEQTWYGLIGAYFPTNETAPIDSCLMPDGMYGSGFPVDGLCPWPVLGSNSFFPRSFYTLWPVVTEALIIVKPSYADVLVYNAQNPHVAEAKVNGGTYTQLFTWDGNSSNDPIVAPTGSVVEPGANTNGRFQVAWVRVPIAPVMTFEGSGGNNKYHAAPSPLTLYVDDISGNTDPLVKDSISVQVTSETGEFEVFTLVETGEDTHLFEVLLSTELSDNIGANNGIIDVPAGTQIWGSYVTLDLSITAPVMAQIVIQGNSTSKILLIPCSTWTGLAACTNPLGIIPLKPYVKTPIDAPARIRLVDASRNEDGLAVEVIDGDVSLFNSENSPQYQMVSLRLTETGPSTGVFEADVWFSSPGSPYPATSPTMAIMFGQSGNSITATYQDPYEQSDFVSAVFGLARFATSSLRLFDVDSLEARTYLPNELIVVQLEDQTWNHYEGEKDTVSSGALGTQQSLQDAQASAGLVVYSVDSLNKVLDVENITLFETSQNSGTFKGLMASNGSYGKNASLFKPNGLLFAPVGSKINVFYRDLESYDPNIPISIDESTAVAAVVPEADTRRLSITDSLYSPQFQLFVRDRLEPRYFEYDATNATGLYSPGVLRVRVLRDFQVDDLESPAMADDVTAPGRYRGQLNQTNRINSNAGSVVSNEQINGDVGQPVIARWYDAGQSEHWASAVLCGSSLSYLKLFEAAERRYDPRDEVYEVIEEAKLRVVVADPNKDVNPDKQESVIVEVKTENDSEILAALETTTNSGIFVAPIAQYLSDNGLEKNNGQLETHVGDVLTFTYVDDTPTSNGGEICGFSDQSTRTYIVGSAERRSFIYFLNHLHEPVKELQWPGQYYVRLVNGAGNQDPSGVDEAYIGLAAAGKVPATEQWRTTKLLETGINTGTFEGIVVLTNKRQTPTLAPSDDTLADAATQTVFASADVELGDRMYASFENPRDRTDRVRKVIPIAFEKLIIHWYLSQSIASLGDLVVNRLEIENPNPVVVPAGVVLDLSMVGELRLHPDSLRLPPGVNFKPAPGRAYAIALPEIGKGDRLRMSWADAVPPGVTVGAKEGRAIAMRGERALSDTKRVELRIEQDPLFEQGQLVGRVYLDPNANGWKETYEPGWRGAVLYTNLGHKITTDRHGRFHVGPLPPGNVTVKLDPSSVPVGTVIDPPVQTAQIWPGEMSKLNFALRPSGETVAGDWVEMPFMNAEVSNLKAGYLLNGSLSTAFELGGQPVVWRWVDLRAVQIRQGTLVMREVSLKPLSFEYDIPDPALAVSATVELEVPGEGILFRHTFVPGANGNGTIVYPETQRLLEYEGREVYYRLYVAYSDGVRSKTADIAFRILRDLPTEKLATASNFDVGSRSVEPLTIKNLKAAAELLRSYPNARVIIEGHTDNTGPRELNIRLSKLRAEKGKEYMAVVEEIDPDRVIARGYGPDYPLATNATEAGRTINRRVVVTVEGLPSQNAKTFEPLIQVGERSIKLANDKERVKTLVQPGLHFTMRDSMGREVLVPFTDPGVRVQVPASTVAREPEYPIVVTVTAPGGARLEGSLDATHAVTGTTEYRVQVRKQKKIRVAVVLPGGLTYEVLANVDLAPLDKKQDRKKLDPARYLRAQMPTPKVKLPREGFSFFVYAPTGTTLEVSPGSAHAVTEGVYLVQTGRLPQDIVDIQLTTTTADNLRVAINRTYPVQNSSLIYVGSAEGRGELFRQSVGTAEHPNGRGYQIDVEGAALIHGDLNENADMTLWVGGPRSDVDDVKHNWLSLSTPTINPSALSLRERAAYMTYADDATVESIIAPLGPAYIHMRYKSSEVGWGVFRSRRLKFSLLDDSDLHAGAWGWLSSAPPQTERAGRFMVEYSTDGTWSTGVGGFVTPKLHGRATDHFTTVGTSLYYLRNQRVVPGSEQVELGVLDARTGLLRDRRILLRGEDYRIDYVLGQVILLKAIPFLVGTDSLILDSAAGRDSPLLAVRYDHEVVLGDTQWSHRELVSQRMWDLVEVQGYYHEQRDALEVSRRGGSRVEIGDPETALGSFEYGRVLGGSQTDWLSEDGGLSWYSRTISDSVGLGADAYRGQLYVQKGMVRYSADGIFYDDGYQRATGTFNTQRFTLLNEVGLYPADVTDGFWDARWGRPSVVGRHAMLRHGSTGAFDQIEEGQLGYEFDPWDTRLGLENRHGPTDELSILAGELGYKFWRMRVYGRHQHMVREITNQSALERWISSLGTQVMWTDTLSTDVRASYGEATWGGTLGFGYHNISGQTISVYSNYMQRHDDGAQAWGVGTAGEQPIGAATRLSASQRYDIGDTQRGWFSGVGAQTSLLNPLTVSARFEKGRMHSLLDDRATVDRMVVGAGLSLGWRALKLSTNGEMRDDKTETVGSNVKPIDQRQYNTWSNGRYNWNEEVYSIATAGYSLTISTGTGARLARNLETGIGLGYRPVKKNFIDTLGMLRYLDTTYPLAQVGPAGVKSARSLILSEDTYFQFPFRLFARHKGAVKRARLSYTGDPVALTTMLNVAGVGWRFWGPLYAYSEYRLLWQFETGVVQHGPTAELGVNPQDWIYFGIGYNFSRIDDTLYNVDPFDREGIYARLRIEF